MSSAVNKMAGKGVFQRPTLASATPIVFPSKNNQKQDTRAMEKLLLKRRAAGFSLMPPVDQLAVIKDAEKCATILAKICNGESFVIPQVASLCADTLSRLENLKTEIIRRAMVDAANHKKNYRYET